ncbi:MAG: UPF0164 family protein [Elusimicrobia bacterium]|nr:UPF0164 family protein [Elusimicrobiota bacterium]
MRALLASAASLWLACGTCAALGTAARGTSGAAFLQIAPGARPAALGEAFAAVADDVQAAYYNPAGLSGLKQVQAGAMHESRFAGLSYQYAALAVPLLSWVDSPRPPNAFGVAAVSFYSLSASGIERRGTVETDEPVDTFGAQDMAYALSYGYAPPGLPVSFGATAKAVSSRLDDARASAAALDAGALYRDGRASGALGFRHLGTRRKFRDAAEPLPLTWYAGGAYRFSGDWLACLEADLPRDDAPSAAAGLEYRRELGAGLSAAARGGFNSGRSSPGGLSGLSLGFGLGYRGWSFDFAWLPAGELGDSFRYFLLLRF